MGQQQLLLIILVTVIVGLATVIAINTFQSAAEEANVDAIRQDILQAQAHATGYAIKPVHIGGGGGSYEGISLLSLSLPHENEHAVYSLGEVSDDSFQIVAVSSRGFTVTATISGDEIEWERE
jgi:hypothetical protein